MNFFALQSNSYKTFNKLGECALTFAPKILMADGSKVVPQQFLEVRRCLESVENILAEVQLPEGFLLFAGQTDNVVFLQVGIVGYENYPNKKSLKIVRDVDESVQNKIVYGRRWMLEPTTPTSEVIQTAFLAVKKAREHELREHIYWLNFLEDGSGQCQRTTPFNTHLDLPLMVNHKTSLYEPEKTLENAEDVKALLAKLRVANYRIKLVNMQALNDVEAVFQLQVISDDLADQSTGVFSELLNQIVSFVCKTSENLFLHELFLAILKCSDRYVEQVFAFKGLARFSADLSIEKKAEFSFLTRNPENIDARFKPYFDNMSYEVDAAKAPNFNQGTLGQKQKHELKAYSNLQGYLPLDV